MKNILTSLLLMVSLSGFSQKGGKPPVYGEVTLENNILYQVQDGVKLYKGMVFISPTSGISKDANGNFIIADRPPTFIGNNYNNLIFGNSLDFRGGANSVAGLGTDYIVYPGASYSIFGGDAGHVGGYSSTTFGYFNKNFVEAGTAIGTEIVLGKQLENNKYLRTAGIGTQMNLQNTDIFMFGYGSGVNVEWNTKGTFLSSGLHKFGLLPDGKVLINGVQYTFPTSNGVGVLTNDGNGNLSWGNTSSTLKSQSTGTYMAYSMTGQPMFLVKINQQ